MAGIAVGWSALIDSIYMTICAGDVDVCARQWECGLAVIKGRRRPCCRAVADGAVVRECRGHMIWIGDAIVIL